MPSSANPKDQLLAGVEILGPALSPHGFLFELATVGNGSGGPFASGAFKKDDRRLELHFRYSLGLVQYQIDQDALDHEIYMRLLGVYGRNQYPDFPKEPLDSFPHLAADIGEYCGDFTSGDGQQFRALAASFRQDPMMFKGIS
jgi:hypothetical protein